MRKPTKTLVDCRTICKVRFDMMSNDDEHVWTGVTRDRRSRGNQQLKLRADHDAWATELKSCRRDLGPEVSDAPTHAAKILQQQRDGLNGNCEFRDADRHGSSCRVDRIQASSVGCSMLRKDVCTTSTTSRKSVDTCERLRRFQKLKQQSMLVQNVACCHDTCAMAFPKAGEE